MSKKVDTIWWVHPAEGHTNEVIALHLRLDAAEHAHEDVLCADGKRRNLWSCPNAKITMLRNSQAHVQAKFKVYRQRGGEKPAPWPFPKKRTLNAARKKGHIKPGSAITAPR